MSDLLSNLTQASLIGVATIGFTAGLAGSLHCVGMCGAFATSCGSNPKGLIAYHTGKLTSYGLLGVTAGVVGASFSHLTENAYLKVLPSILMGGLFIYLGVKSLHKKKVQIPLPSSVQKLNQRLMVKTFAMKEGTFRSFFTGFLSALLPCGLLYGMILSFAVLQNPYSGAVGMISFGVGTIPALAVAPHIILKVLKPIKNSWPKLSSLSLISLGLITISYRMVVAYGQASCH